MWEFRRRPDEQDEAQNAALDKLFDQIPALESLYNFRWDVTDVFDTAPNREVARTRLEELRVLVADTEPELLEFFKTYDNWQEGILAYFDQHQTSAAVEGLNNKARVITKRAYGLKSADSLWTRLLLDVNRAGQVAWRSIEQVRNLSRQIKATFCGYYT
jgi:transposase